VAKKSPIRSMTDEEWNELVEYWKSPKKWYVSSQNLNSCVIHATCALHVFYN
jgi:hypothetical protein